MTVHDLADALEGRREGAEWRCRCPVHGGRSLCIREKDGKILVTCRAGCPQREVIDAIRTQGLWSYVSGNETPPPPPPGGIERKADRASALWEQAKSISPGDPVHTYFAGRGIVLPDYSKDIRTHPALDYWEIQEDKPVRIGVYPAMLAVVRSPTGRPVALHRTYVTSDGEKAPVPNPKKILKVHDLTGSAVRLFPPQDGFIAVCEGIEDALSAWILWGIPTWACVGTTGLKSFHPPEGVKEVLILADNDPNGAGHGAALHLGDRLKEKGMAVRIASPIGLKDVNAILQGKGSV